MKTLKNTDSSGTTHNVPDVEFFGISDMFKLISKAHSDKEGWMKSTKAMEIQGAGCVIQTTTQQRNPDGSYALTDALVFVPNVSVVSVMNKDNTRISHRILKRTDKLFEENTNDNQNKNETISVNEAGSIAVKISEMAQPPLTGQDQAFFIAGFQECVKWMSSNGNI